jgi:2-(1,2-epoxy-1,2-dihydrophenyl)acetyl-CoA isomerase
MESTLLETTEGGVLTLTLNRPERRNALDVALIAALSARLAAAGEDRAVRCVVLTGAGGAFCAGADLKEVMTGGQDADASDVMERAYNPAIRAIRRMPKPVIAAVDGVATGYGASLALAADIRLASERARFALIFARVGLTLDGGASWFLPRLVGLRAYELALTGDLIDAAEAHRIGLVNHVHPAPDLGRETAALARRLAAGAPLALAAIKANLNAALGPALDAVLEDERIAQRRLFASADVREGAMAFIEKRPARFTGE